jgi:hypothetical protein
MVFYEKKGVKTDLFAIEKYVDELYSEIEDNRRGDFLKEAFTAVMKQPLAVLNQL